MSKAEDKKQNEEPTYDHTRELKNLQYTINLREAEIYHIKQDNIFKAKHITQITAELHEIRACLNNTFQMEKTLAQLRAKNDNLEKENERLSQEVSFSKMRHEEEKRKLDAEFSLERRKLQTIIDNYLPKIELCDQLIKDNSAYKEIIENNKKEMEKIMLDHLNILERKELAAEKKQEKLKRKMVEHINKTQASVGELNMKTMNASNKLTILQNEQLLIQLEYQTQQIDELLDKKKLLEDKVFELTKDIEIHKEVELSLAEKNKRLQQDNKKKKMNDHSQLQEDTIIINPTNVSENNNNNHSRDYSNALHLEKKIYNLERKLYHKCKEYGQLKDTCEYIEIRLKNYEQKYSGLFKFFEDSLRQFFDDEEIKRNKEIYVNMEALKRGDFSSFSQEEKYSVLVILMKYLLPLVTSNEIANNQSSTSHVGLKFHYTQKYIDDPDLKKIFGVKGRTRMNQSSSCASLPVLRKR